ncbi:MICAL-like protein 1 isoform X2 [Mobula hypostoma]|uniref:MICAL-like protein 1 isoform X2 n=1 Tax=Mobula hypostoma TaxID=723540 RepID=UPI002FC2C10A
MATRALQEWARRQVDGYPGVEVKNMTSSFRDGLAFCAIIHRHRPDLIDFDSLSKENVYENNRLAFEVAEQELGIPALLDAEDMVAMRVPDRLSILTYVSQLYNYFTNQTHAGVPPTMKRPAAISPSEPSVKKVVTVNKQVLSPHSDSPVAADERPQRNTLSSTCAICNKHVHLVQRYLVDGKLYHRNCFRCKECSSTLLPGAYKPGAHSGTFVCTHHRGRVAGQPQRPVSGPSLPSYHGSLPAQIVSSASPRTPHHSQVPTEASDNYGPSPMKRAELNAEESGEKSCSPGSGLSPSVPSEHYHPSTDKIPKLSNSTDLKETSKPSVESQMPEATRRSADQSVCKDQTENGISKQPESGTQPDLLISPNEQQLAVVMETDIAAESTNTSEPPARCNDQTPDTSHTKVSKEAAEEQLKTLPVPVPRKTVDSATSPVATPRPVPRPRVSFGGGTSETSVQRSETGELANALRSAQSPAPKTSPSPSLSMESITGDSAKSTPELHRRFEDGPALAAKSPEAACKTPIGVSGAPEVVSETGGSPELASRSPSDTSTIPETASENPEMATESPASTGGSAEVAGGSPATKETTTASNESPAPLSYHRPPPKPPSAPSPVPSLYPSPESNRVNAASTDPQSKSSCKENPFDRKSSPAGGAAPLRPRKGPKPARPPAPGHGFPLIKRKVHANQYIPEESIQGELEQLEQQLDELELRGVALEEKLRNCENDDDEDDLLVDWFKLIHEKHLLVRHESELVYTFKQQNLEERQADVEYELRCLLNKPEKDWTDEDRARETELMQELITVIEQRNAIINSLDEDRQREEEEDKLLETMIKNKDFHKDPNSEMKKKAKFKPSKMLKFLSNKPEGKSKSAKEKNL